jgi:superfamily I DNA/RNA helicase
LALNYIRKGIRCKIEGRAIGLSLLTLINGLKARNTEELLAKLEVKYTKAYDKFEQQKADKNLPRDAVSSKVQSLRDKIDTIRVLVEKLALMGKTGVPALTNEIDVLFAENVENMLTLSTVHKAKGREWGTVYLYGFPDYMPHPCARLKWEREQEDNLIYVAFTRAINRLFLISAKNNKREQQE